MASATSNSPVHAVPVGSRSWTSIATIACVTAFGASACSLDVRPLRTQPGDSGATEDASSPVATNPGRVHYVDSSAVDYKDAGDLPAPSKPPMSVDAGPCVHTNSFGQLDCEDTLATNADFNRNIVAWDAAQGAVLRWVNFDSDGADGSGSLGVKNGLEGDLDGTISVAASQCVPADPQAVYEYATSMFIRKGQPYGQGLIIVYFYAQPDCQGLVSSANTVAGTDATETWMVAANTLITPENVHSMAVRLHVQKPYRVDPVEVLFDAVRVTRVESASATD